VDIRIVETAKVRKELELETTITEKQYLELNDLIDAGGPRPTIRLIMKSPLGDVEVVFNGWR